MEQNPLRPEDYTEQMLQKHADRVYRTALAILGNIADAEDVVQDTFIKLITKGPLFQSVEHERAWLIRVSVNLCKSRLRTFWYRKTVPLLGTIPARQEEDNLVEAVLALAPKYRTVIHLYYYEGYSTAEIGELTGKRASTVRSLLTRARQKLKKIVEEEANEVL